MVDRVKVKLTGPAKVGGKRRPTGATVTVTDVELRHLVQAGALPKGESPAAPSSDDESLVDQLAEASASIAALRSRLDQQQSASAAQIADIQSAADKRIAEATAAADKRVAEAEKAAADQAMDIQKSANDQLAVYRKEADEQVAAKQAELDALKAAQGKSTK